MKRTPSRKKVVVRKRSVRDTTTNRTKPKKKKPASLRTPSRKARSKSKKKILHHRVKKYDLPKNGKAVFNGQDIEKIPVDEYYTYEYLYFRNMGMEQFGVGLTFKNLRVIDVSFNFLRNLLFLESMPNIRYVFAISNEIRSFCDVFFPKKLETLCLSNNLIKNFEGFPKKHSSIQVLTLRENKINSFRGFPYLPKIQQLFLDGNPIAKVPYFRNLILSCCNVNDKLKINGEKIPKDLAIRVGKKEEIVLRKLVMLTRMGYLPKREFSSLEIDKFVENLNRIGTKNKVLKIFKIGYEGIQEQGKKILFAPFFCVQHGNCLIDPMRNITQHTFKLTCDKGNIDLVIADTPLRMARKEGSNEHVLSIYVPTGEYRYKYIFDGIIDKKMRVVKIMEIDEEKEMKNINDSLLVEGEVVWSRDNDDGGWDVIPNAKKLLYVPSHDDIGHCLRTEFILRKKKKKKLGRELLRVFALTDKIDAGFPTCEMLKIVGETVEGNEITAEYEYNGGVEGKSTIFFYNVDDPENKFENKYTLSMVDVGKVVICEFTPVRHDGLKGETVCLETDVIKQSPPRITKIEFEGTTEEGQVLSLNYDYFGGEEGKSEIKWYRLDNPIKEDENLPENAKLIVGASNRKDYQITDSDINKYFYVKVFPIASTGLKGIPKSIVSEKVIESDPRLLDAKIECISFEEGSTATLCGNYSGGIEGNSFIQWFKVVDYESYLEEDIQEIKGANQVSYKINKSEVGYCLGVKYTPKSVDGRIGEPVIVKSSEKIKESFPMCTSISFEGEYREGEILTVNYEYFGGEEGESKFNWYRVDDENNKYLYQRENGNKYEVWLDDVNHRIMVEYEPVREDGTRGKKVIAFTPKILSKKPRIETALLIYHSSVVGKECEVKYTFEGGIEKYTIFTWMRILNEGENDEFKMKIKTAENSKKYTFSREDIGCKVFCQLVAHNMDEEQSEMFESNRTEIIRNE